MGVRLKVKLRVQESFLQLDERQLGVWRIEASMVQWISNIYRLLLHVKPDNILEPLHGQFISRSRTIRPPQECAHSQRVRACYQLY